MRSALRPNAAPFRLTAERTVCGSVQKKQKKAADLLKDLSSLIGSAALLYLILICCKGLSSFSSSSWTMVSKACSISFSICFSMRSCSFCLSWLRIILLLAISNFSVKVAFGGYTRSSSPGKGGNSKVRVLLLSFMIVLLFNDDRKNLSLP